MLITDQFVLLNMPKTGSTFARDVVREILRRRNKSFCLDLSLPNIKVPGRGSDQHGTYDQIPDEHKHKQIVTVVRNPYERIVSSYRYGWWKDNPGVPREDAQLAFPSFPILNFKEYMALTDLSAARKLGGTNTHEIGNQTLQFIQMYFSKAACVLRRLDPNLILSNQYNALLPPIRYLRSESLNGDLAQFLEDMGYDRDEVALCRGWRRVNVTQGAHELPWTNDLVERFCYSERLLFKILEDIGLTYSLPTISTL
jgi:hypothetical protein